MSLRNFAASVLSNLGVRALAQPAGFAIKAASVSAVRLFSSVAEGYRYAESHEWAKLDGDVATVGISDHAQGQLGDIVYVELPDVGHQYKAGDSFGVVESVKAASDVYAPVGGEVVEVNKQLTDNSELVNKEPYKAGWIMKLKVSNKADYDKLLDAAAYKAQLPAE